MHRNWLRSVTCARTRVTRVTVEACRFCVTSLIVLRALSSQANLSIQNGKKLYGLARVSRLYTPPIFRWIPGKCLRM